LVNYVNCRIALSQDHTPESSRLENLNKQPRIFYLLFSLQMTRYKQTDFADEDASSIGSVHLNEVRTSPNMHIRFANRVSVKSEYNRTYSKFHKQHCSLSPAELVHIAVASSQPTREISHDRVLSAVLGVCPARHHIGEGGRDADPDLARETASSHG
jgi:hypothetical protein